MKKVLISSGGTGGHLYPALAVADKLREKDVEVIFVGSRFRMEKDLIPEQKYRFAGLPIKPFNKFSSLAGLMESIAISLKIIKEENPDVILGFGNYITVPVIIAAMICRKKIYLHEQNVKMGMANNLFYRFCEKIFLSYDSTFEVIPAKYQQKAIITGNPVRKEFYSVNRNIEREKLKFEPDEKMVLIVGGSLGAQSINSAVYKKWEKIFAMKNIRVYWSTGKNNFNEINGKITKLKKNDMIKPYFNNIAGIMAAADVVLGRAGGSIIAEIIILEKPSIIVPSGNKRTGQFDNPGAIRDAGGCEIFEDQYVEKAIERLFEIITDDEKLKEMSTAVKKLKKENSAEKIIEEIDIWRN